MWYAGIITSGAIGSHKKIETQTKITESSRGLWYTDSDEGICAKLTRNPEATMTPWLTRFKDKVYGKRKTMFF